MASDRFPSAGVLRGSVSSAFSVSRAFSLGRAFSPLTIVYCNTKVLSHQFVIGLLRPSTQKLARITHELEKCVISLLAKPKLIDTLGELAYDH